MTRSRFQTIAIAAVATTAFAVPAGAAFAGDAELRLLGLPLPDLGQVVTDVGGTLGDTVDTILPGTGAIVTETTGTVGGIITGTTQTVNDAVDQTVGGILDGTDLGGIVGPNTSGGGTNGGLLPTDALTTLLQTLGFQTVGQAKGTVVNADGSVTVDSRAPGVTFKALSKLRNVKKDGKLKLQVATDEPGIVAFTSTVRPGLKVKARKQATRKARTSATKHSRKVIHIPAVTLGFRKAGSLKVTVQLSKAAQRNLGSARDARISVGMIASDAARNQTRSRVKKTVAR